MAAMIGARLCATLGAAASAAFLWAGPAAAHRPCILERPADALERIEDQLGETVFAEGVTGDGSALIITRSQRGAFTVILIPRNPVRPIWCGLAGGPTLNLVHAQPVPEGDKT